MQKDNHDRQLSSLSQHLSQEGQALCTSLNSEILQEPWVGSGILLFLQISLALR